jgi:hypothetical protein
MLLLPSSMEQQECSQHSALMMRLLLLTMLQMKTKFLRTRHNQLRTHPHFCPLSRAAADEAIRSAKRMNRVQLPLLAGNYSLSLSLSLSAPIQRAVPSNLSCNIIMNGVLGMDALDVSQHLRCITTGCQAQIWSSHTSTQPRASHPAVTTSSCCCTQHLEALKWSPKPPRDSTMESLVSPSQTAWRERIC